EAGPYSDVDDPSLSFLPLPPLSPPFSFFLSPSFFLLSSLLPLLPLFFLFPLFPPSLLPFPSSLSPLPLPSPPLPSFSPFLPPFLL
ncbi:hypothetical protein ACXWRS_10745, partial [Streptococcus pyogenes]